jgi:hypothetical protein
MPKKALPTFLICGAQKAGTTALYEALRAHPDVCMSRPKETEFFNWRYHRGWDWFSERFDHHNGESAIGEASTRTMPHPEAPERIATGLPDASLIFVLRNPVERAHSAFWYYIAQGILCPGTDFSTFIRNEGHPLRQEIVHYGYYDRHLARFLQVFEQSQCQLVRHRDLRENMPAELDRICQFIGVSPFGSEGERASTQSNTTQYPHSQLLHNLGRRLWKPIGRLLSWRAPDIAETIRRVGKRWSLGGSRPSLAPSDRAYLWERYESTANEIEARFSIDLAHWGLGDGVAGLRDQTILSKIPGYPRQILL